MEPSNDPLGERSTQHKGRNAHQTNFKSIQGDWGVRGVKGESGALPHLAFWFKE